MLAIVTPLCSLLDVGRRKHSLDSTEAERRRIRELYRQGIRIVDIARLTKRSESLIQRTVRRTRATEGRQDWLVRQPQRG